MEELKDCPFCGHKLKEYPMVMLFEKRNINCDLFFIHCTGCGATGPGGYCENEAIDQWNRRGQSSHWLDRVNK